MKLKGTLALTCNECNKRHWFSDEEGDFEVIMTQPSATGIKKIHEMAFDFNCDRCGNQIDVDYLIHLSPDGSFEMDNLIIKGGTMLSKYEVYKKGQESVA